MFFCPRKEGGKEGRKEGIGISAPKQILFAKDYKACGHKTSISHAFFYTLLNKLFCTNNSGALARAAGARSGAP